MNKITAAEKYGDYAPLYHDVFNDGFSFTEKALSCCDKVFEIYSDNKTVAGTMCFDVSVKCNGDLKKGAYIYGLCVDKNYRHKGYCRELLNSLTRFYTENNYDFLFLIPADKCLFSMYRKFGFETGIAGTVKEGSYSPDNLLSEEYILSDFDNDFDNLYRIHRENDFFIKNKPFFLLSVEDFDIKYIRKSDKSGYALFSNGKSVYSSLADPTVSRFEKGLLKFLNEDFVLPDCALCDIFLEI